MREIKVRDMKMSDSYHISKVLDKMKFRVDGEFMRGLLPRDLQSIVTDEVKKHMENGTTIDENAISEFGAKVVEEAVLEQLSSQQNLQIEFYSRLHLVENEMNEFIASLTGYTVAEVNEFAWEESLELYKQMTDQGVFDAFFSYMLGQAPMNSKTTS